MDEHRNGMGESSQTLQQPSNPKFPSKPLKNHVARIAYRALKSQRFPKLRASQ